MTQTRPEPKVIIIPAKEESPQDQEKKKNLRVAAYCRVSTKKDEQLGSYENQKAYYTEKIMANPNWTMADIFADATDIIGLKQNPTNGRRFSPIFLCIGHFSE